MIANVELQQRLCNGLAVMKIDLNIDQIQCLLQLVQLLIQWNRSYNLTAIREPMQMISHHVLDSLSLLPFIQTTPILDLGTGAGFPGLPLAIACPELTFTLLDSNGKKIRFVRQVIMELKLHNVTPIQARIENYVATTKFPTIIARALAPLSQLTLWADKLLTPNGTLLALKSKNIATELACMNPAQISQHKLQVPYIEGERVLVAFRKN
jgi:16S rRNA (guanine527-N7)-methyltransferase